MITLTITHDAVEQVYIDEVESFSWETVNNEGVGFSVSVPNLTGVVVLSAADAFLKQLVKGDKIEIESDIGSGLVLTLYVIETTVLDRKGMTEISCSGNFLTEASSILGTLVVKADAWANTQALYGLEAVEMHESNKGFLVNVRKKEDIVLGVAWADERRKNVAVTPFATGGGEFAGDGLGIFKEDSDPPANSVTPLYKVDADQIVSYEVGPAQPPVTHIQTTELGDLGATPQIPILAVPKYSGAVGSRDIDANVKTYYIEELGLSAIYTANENEAGEIISQSLTWSDGFVNTWAGAAQQYAIIGIVRGGYVAITEMTASSTVISVIDRETGEALATFTLTGLGAPLDLYDYAGTDYRTQFKTYKTNEFGPTNEYPTMDDMEIVWFRRVTDAGEMALIYYPQHPEGPRGIIWTVSATYKQYFFGESCKVVPLSSYRGFAIKAVLFHIVEAGAKLAMTVFRINQESAAYVTTRTPAESYLFNPAAVIPAGYGYTNLRFLDYIAYGAVTGSSAPDEFLLQVTAAQVIGTSPEDHQMVAIPIFIELRKGSGTSEITWTWSDGPTYSPKDAPHEIKYLLDTPTTARWAITGQEIGVKYEDAKILVVKTNGVWYLANFDRGSGLSIKVAQTGDVLSWTGASAVNYFLGRGMVVVATYKGANYWDVFLQTGMVPFLSRKCGEATMSLKIAEGTKNPALLAFKVGALQQEDRLIWDVEIGRIALEVVAFYVKKNSDGTWIEKSVQGLNVPAVGAYMYVYITPDDEEADIVTKVKITGCALTYSGLAKLRLSGIIVQAGE